MKLLRCVAISAIAILGSRAHAAEQPWETQGYVLVRLGMNSQVVDGYTEHFDEIRLISLETVPRGATLRLLRGRDRTRTFGGWVRPGNWGILDLRGAAKLGGTPGETYTQVHAIKTPFPVEAGALTDLGALIYMPFGADKLFLFRFPAAQDSRTTLRRDLSEDVEAPFNKTLTWYAESEVPPPPPKVAQEDLSFKDAFRSISAPDHLPTPPKAIPSASDAKLRAAVIHVAGQFNGSFVAADGTFYVGSSVGQIWQRIPAGVWRTLDTGCTCDILAVRLEGESLYAGSEFGAVFRSTDGGATFSEVSHSPDGHGIVLIDRLNSGEWLIMTREIADDGGPIAGNISLFHKWTLQRSFYVITDPSGLEAATAALSIKYKIGAPYIGPDMLGKPPGAALTPEGFIVFEPPNKLHRYDSSSRAFSTHSAPASDYRMFSNQSGSVLVLDESGLRSNDSGKSWQKIDRRSTRRQHLALFENGTGFQLVPWRSYPGTKSVFVTRDGGKTWAQGGNFTENSCYAFAANEKLGQIYCNSPDGFIRASSDALKWTVEQRSRQE
jgi:hypothetical protein